MGGDGKTLRETLEVVERMTGRAQDESVNPAPFPDVLHDLWTAFMRLNSARQPGFSGPSPITESEIRAYCLNRCTRLQAWEIDVIRALDGIALSGDGG